MHITIHSQPDDVTCGPTTLHAVYNYFDYNIPLNDLIGQMRSLEDGGTLAVMLGIDALERGFNAEILSYNLRIFDLSWRNLSSTEMMQKLENQLHHKKGKKFRQASLAYIEFLSKGGKIRFDDLSISVLQKSFDKNIPVLAGLSSTYLYQTPREHFNHHNKSVYDDTKGYPIGHFVVLCDLIGDRVVVADPYKENPISRDHYYEVDAQRLLHSILLGIISYDANLLFISPKTAS